jgi:competence ComEA-like helix-hairpin-helix protein
MVARALATKFDETPGKTHSVETHGFAQPKRVFSSRSVRSRVMQGNFSHFAQTRPSSLSLGSNHGYRFEGDTAILNAELALADVNADTFDGAHDQPAPQWALQLWACETPYQGGPLHGVKVAEAELLLPALHDEPTRLETAAFARLPPTHGEYNMVLVLASGDQGRYDQVHDFSNYAERQQFTGPRLDGTVGYRIESGEVVLQIESVCNTRDEDNLSGTLALELWALNGPYHGGPLYGQLLAQSTLGRLEGQGEQQQLEHRVALTEASVGTWDVALVLREWTAAEGYVTRDYCNFAAPHVVAPYESAAAPAQDEPWQSEAQPVFAERDAWGQEAPQQDEQATFAPYEAEAPAAPTSIDAAPPAVELPVEHAVVEPQAVTAAVVISKAVAVQASAVEAALPGTAEPALSERETSQPVVAEAAPVEAKPAEAKPAEAKPAEAKKVADKPAPVANTLKAAPVAAPAVAREEKPRVSVQTASVDELAGVDGLNRKLAQAIVKARPFQALEDVVKVRGIGDKMLQRLRDQLTL